ncbi:MAG: N-acetyl-gamma-glutamyl-phosphate reductase [Oscillospiraceae bacterium]
MDKIKVGIIGATGYAGIELIRLIINHPQAKLSAISSVSYEGKPLSEVYPNMAGICDDILVNEDEVINKSDVIFASLPHGLCEAIAKKVDQSGKKLIDLGADFRLSDESDYKQWYGLEYKEKTLHEKAVYCIPELHRQNVKNATIIANPGCYPTSVSLGLAPIIHAGLADMSTIIIDSKSGATGAGRGLAINTHFTECNEAFGPYKVATHRHTPEIEEVLSTLSGEDVKVTFVPHLLPVNRGIISTIYLSLKSNTNSEDIYKIYKEFYKSEQFIRIMPLGMSANLKNVTFSNYCDISLHLDTRTNRLVVVSTIDNMVKGAAGQAIQNMNILFGIEEGCGLKLVPPAI